MQKKGTPENELVDPDNLAISDLEAILGKKIPPASDPVIDFGFRAKKGHVLSLALTSCNIKRLPESMENLRFLRYLDLSLNELEELPPSISRLLMLEELELNFNQLATIPEEICQLVHLRSLDLSENQIVDLPDGIGALKSLQELYLRDNKLSALPAAVWNLPRLETLDLSDNNFSSLPVAVGHLKSLDILEIQGNPFPTLPDALLLLPALHHLGIDSSLATSSLIQDLRKKNVEISVRKSLQRLEEEIQNLRMQPPLIPPETILSHLSLEPIHIQELISKLKITDMTVARSLQIELRKLEASKKIQVIQREGRKFYSLKESITTDSD